MSLVYSTDRGRICPQCGSVIAECICKQKKPQESGDGTLRLQRQTQGRSGKVVTVVSGLNLTPAAIKELAKKLKQLCGSGGTIGDGTIEIQGDHCTALKVELERQGFRVKLIGG